MTEIYLHFTMRVFTYELVCDQEGQHRRQHQQTNRVHALALPEEDGLKRTQPERVYLLRVRFQIIRNERA